MTNASTTPARDAADHLLLGAADLDEGTRLARRLTGVKAVAGGSHPARARATPSSRSEGASIWRSSRPTRSRTPSPSPASMGCGPAQPRLITWAAASKDIAATAARARQAGLEVSDPSDGSRAPRWKAPPVEVPARAEHGRNGRRRTGPVLHRVGGRLAAPSQDSRRAARSGPSIEHPEPARVIKAPEKLGITAKVGSGERARLLATLDPQGRSATELIRGGPLPSSAVSRRCIPSSSTSPSPSPSPAWRCGSSR
jgi:hypothetical protein